MSTQKEWELEQQVQQLTSELNGAETEIARITRERGEAIQARYDDQAENIRLRSNLAARNDECDDLRAKLAKAEAKAEGVVARENIKYQILDDAFSENITLLDGASAQIKALLTENHHLKDALASALRRNKELILQNKVLTSTNNLLRSQVGNILVVNGKVQRWYYLLEVLRQLPIVGGLFTKASIEIYEQARKKQHSD